MSKTFANSINSNPLYAERAEQDAFGNTITTTYATKSEVSAVADVPDVTSSDNGKVLKATYENGAGSYGWSAEVKKPIVAGANITITNGTNDVTIAATDTTYTFSNGLTNNSGTITVTNPVPAASSSDQDKVLGVTDSSGTLGWVAQTGGGGGNEVPDVTSSDDGKVLKASYSEGTGSYDWAAPPTEKTLAAGSNVSISSSGSTVTISATDTTYTFSNGLTNSSGTVSVTNPVPAVTSSDDGKVLTATYSGGSGSFAWTTPSGGGGGGSSSATMHAPDKSIIFNFSATPSYNPTTSGTTWLSGSTWTRLDSANNIWLWTGPSGSWANAFYDSNNETSKLPGSFGIESMQLDGEITSIAYLLRRAGVRYIRDISSMYVEDASYAFANTQKLTGEIYIPGITGCQTAEGMFEGSSINSVRIDWLYGHYNESDPEMGVVGYYDGCVTSYMFTGCYDLKLVRLGNSGSVLVSSASYMFSNCSSLTDLETLQIVTFMDASFEGLCEGCRSLTKFPDLDFTTSRPDQPDQYYSMGDTNKMFSGCESLLRMPNFTGHLENVSNAREMFKDCRSLVSIRWSSIENLGKSESYDEGTGETTISYSMNNIYMMFAGCWNVVHGAVDAYNGMSSLWDNLSNHGYAFSYVGADVGSTETDSIPYSWGGTQS